MSLARGVLLLSLLGFIIRVSPVLYGESEAKKSEEMELYQHRERILRYGINSSIISLISELSKEKNGEFNELLIEEAARSLDPDMMVATLEHLTLLEETLGIEWAVDLLGDEDILPSQVVITAIRYLSKVVDVWEEANPIISMVDHPSEGIAEAAIAAIGASGDVTNAEVLILLLEEEDISQNLRGNAITALGELKAESARDLLTRLLEDTASPKGIRWRATQALGKIANPESLELFEELMSDEDHILRAYVAEAVGGFEGERADEIIRFALRDSSWNVRYSATKQIGIRQASQFMDFLIYLSEEDPELKVRQEAVVSLGEIDDPASMEHLIDMGSNTATEGELWLIAMNYMIESALPTSLEALKGLVTGEWEKRDSQFLGHLAKKLSTTKSEHLEELLVLLLSHNNQLIQAYGIRGIGNNKLTAYRDAITKMAEETSYPLVKREATKILNDFESP